MNKLDRQAWGGLVFFLLALGLLLFVPAWSLMYWQAWVYIVVFGISVSTITFYLMKQDRELLARRVGVGFTAEKEASQKVIQFIAQFVFISVYVVSALDYRYQWSFVPTSLPLWGDVFVVLGFYIVFLTFKENSFTSATVEVGEGQQVITTGPYAWVRHPMYSGALMMLLATPIALGSYWGLLTFIPMLFIIVWRLLQEEKYLAKNLPGYSEYCKKTRARLVPFLY